MTNVLFAKILGLVLVVLGLLYVTLHQLTAPIVPAEQHMKAGPTGWAKSFTNHK